MTADKKVNNIKYETRKMKTRLKGKLIKIRFPRHIQDKYFPEK